jgi:hypothetical protein
MNERIRQLYYECQDESQSTEQCYQKFAELIVKECAELCDNLQKWPSTEPRHCAEEIREHFGVDE